MKFPSFKSRSSDDDEEEETTSEIAQSKTEQEPPVQKPDGEQKPSESKDKRRRGFFSRGPKEGKESKSVEEESGSKAGEGGDEDSRTGRKRDLPSGRKTVDAEPSAPKKRGSFSLRKKKEPIPDVHPTDLVHVEGQRVVVPTYEDIEKYGKIIYPVSEPYQFISLEIVDGEL